MAMSCHKKLLPSNESWVYKAFRGRLTMDLQKRICLTAPAGFPAVHKGGVLNPLAIPVWGLPFLTHCGSVECITNK